MTKYTDSAWKQLSSHAAMACLANGYHVLCDDACAVEPGITVQQKLSAAMKKKMTVALDADIARLDDEVQRYVDIVVCSGSKDLDMKIGRKNILVTSLGSALKVGQVVRAFLLLADRVDVDNLKSLDSFYDPAAPEPLAALWSNVGAELRTLRTRLSNCAIAVSRSLSEQLAAKDALAEKLVDRSSKLLTAAPEMCKKWLKEQMPVAFEDPLKTLQEDLAAIDKTELMRLANTTPVNLDSIATIAKKAEARTLYSSFCIFDAGLKSFRDVASQYSAECEMDTTIVNEAKTIVGIFSITQAMVRKLKVGETRSELAKSTKASVSSSGGSIPPPLMLVLDNACSDVGAPAEALSVADELESSG